MTRACKCRTAFEFHCKIPRYVLCLSRHEFAILHCAALYNSDRRGKPPKTRLPKQQVDQHKIHNSTTFSVGQAVEKEE